MTVRNIKLFAIFLVALTFAVTLSACAGATDNTQPADIAEPAPVSDMTVSAAENEGAADTQVLGVFSTEFNAKNERRTNNIQLASDAIDQCIVQSGEVFSYNDTVGPTSKRNGYQRSTIFIRGEKFEGYGGGVCQVSSTLYNAAANAGMTIVERHDHSMPVDYVETGKDAATSYGGIDFKFQNTLDVPVVISSHVEDGNITISLNAV